MTNGDIWQRDDMRSKFPLQELAERTAKATGITLEELLGRERTEHVSLRRHVFFYAAIVAGHPLTSIGRFCGGKSSGAVLHGRRRISNEMETSLRGLERIEALLKTILQ